MWVTNGWNVQREFRILLLFGQKAVLENLRTLHVLPSQLVGHVHTFGAVQLPRTHSGLQVAVAQFASV